MNYHAKIHRVIKYSIITFLLFVALIASVSIFTNQSAFHHVTDISIQLLITLLILSLINYLLRSYRWYLFSKSIGHHAPFWETIIIYVAGFAFATTPGKLGEAIRLWFINRCYGFKYEETGPLYVADKMSDLHALLLLALIGVGFFSGYLWIAGIVAGCIYPDYSNDDKACNDTHNSRSWGKYISSATVDIHQDTSCC